MLINHLFNTPIICSINYKQATTINKPKNWNKTECLSNIFEEQREWYEKNKKDKNEDITFFYPKEEDTIYFYLFLVDDNNNEKNYKKIIDVWYDID